MTTNEQFTGCTPLVCTLVHSLVTAEAQCMQFYVYWPPAADEHKVPVRKLLCFKHLWSSALAD
jgi:hypothetical protein